VGRERRRSRRWLSATTALRAARRRLAGAAVAVFVLAVVGAVGATIAGAGPVPGLPRGGVPAAGPAPPGAPDPCVSAPPGTCSTEATPVAQPSALWQQWGGAVFPTATSP